MTKGDYQNFNLGSNDKDDYILPSLNLLPKVHKLKERTSQNNENLLTGRPIVTGYGWCTIEASKFLQKKLGTILCNFKKYLIANGLPNSILGNSNELVEVIKQTRISSLVCLFSSVQ